jgi:hypothetical protein
MQLDLFGECTAPSSSLAGLELLWPSPCANCGANTIIVGSSRGMHHAGLRCACCRTHRGWLGGQDANRLKTEIDRLGGKRPTTPISIL